MLVAARLVQLLKKLHAPDSVNFGSFLYLYPCCTSCSQAGPVTEETAGSIQYQYCTCIPAVLVAARLVQLLKKLQVPDRKVHPRQAGPCIEDFVKERKFSQTGGVMKKELQNDLRIQKSRSHVPFRGSAMTATCLKHRSAQVAAWVAGPVVTVPPTRLWVVFQGRDPVSQKLFYVLERSFMHHTVSC